MKKTFTILALLVFSTSVFAATAPSTKVNSFLDKVTAKENEVTSKIEENQKAREAKKQEIQKKQEANQKAVEQAKKDAQARQEARKNAIQSEINYWKNLGK